MLNKINEFAKDFLEKTKDLDILLINHFDTDGTTSGAIIGRCLKKLDKNFSFKTINSLDKKLIESLPKTKVIIFTDIGSQHLKSLSELPNEIFIIDHHPPTKINIPENIHLLNWHTVEHSEELCSASTAYLLSKALTNKSDPESATLAMIGIVGDIMEKNIGPLSQTIIQDGGIVTKKGLLLYPSTRPLNKALEFCSTPYIPGVTGNFEGATELLREAEIGFTKKGYKSLIELSEEEMKKLVTAIALRLPNADDMSEFLGNLFLVKFFNKQEDARELSALINACSQMGHPHISLLFCMGNSSAKEQADKIYIKYKQSIVSGLKHIDTSKNLEKIEGKSYVLLNAKDNIQDTIIDTITNILSMSSVYEQGKIIIGMAYNGDKIKISACISGKNRKSNSPYNLKNVMEEITAFTGGEAGGHEFAAGCIISKEQEKTFIEVVKKKLDMDIVKV